MAPRLPPAMPSVSVPGRVMPTVPGPNLGGLPVRGVPSPGVISPGGLTPMRPGVISPGGLTPIRPGGVPALAGPTVPALPGGTNLGVSNGLGVTRPGVLLPGGAPATPGLPTSPVSPGLPTRPGIGPGVVAPGVIAPGVVGPGVMPGVPAVPQDQGTFLDRILGQGQQVQIGGPQAPQYPQGMTPQAPGAYPYQQGVIPPRGLPPTGPGGVPGVMTPNGSCRPYNNGLIGFFDNTVGAAVKRMMGIRDNCWGPTGQTTLPPGQVQPGRFAVPQGAGIPPGAMLPVPQATMPQMSAPAMVPGAAVPPGVQLTRPMPVGPRAFQ